MISNRYYKKFKISIRYHIDIIGNLRYLSDNSSHWESDIMKPVWPTLLVRLDTAIGPEVNLKYLIDIYLYHIYHYMQFFV